MAESLQLSEDLVFKNLYVHLPFCKVHCHYCDFFVIPVRRANHPKFLDSLSSEFNLWSPHFGNLKTIYLGGGTPSETPAAELERIFTPLKRYMQEVQEFTIEVNPSSVTQENIAIWKRLGVNRLSIGIQSLVDPVLKTLGRNHNSAEALRAIDLACENFELVCCDLIYGVPGQSLDDLGDSISEFSKRSIKHISAYTLTLTPNHFMFKQLPTPEEALLQAEFVHEQLSQLGFEHYEASNFARPGFRSVHNQNYWSGNSYLGLGPSSHSFDGDRTRWINFPDLGNYTKALESGERPISDIEELSSEQQMIEYFLVRMRTANGFDLSEVEDRFGSGKRQEILGKLEEFQKSGLGQVVDNTWNPSFLGIMLSDSLTEKLI